jgi:hypothetical protein
MARGVWNPSSSCFAACILLGIMDLLFVSCELQQRRNQLSFQGHGVFFKRETRRKSVHEDMLSRKGMLFSLSPRSTAMEIGRQAHPAAFRLRDRRMDKTKLLAVQRSCSPISQVGPTCFALKSSRWQANRALSRGKGQLADNLRCRPRRDGLAERSMTEDGSDGIADVEDDEPEIERVVLSILRVTPKSP